MKYIFHRDCIMYVLDFLPVCTHYIVYYYIIKKSQHFRYDMELGFYFKQILY